MANKIVSYKSVYIFTNKFCSVYLVYLCILTALVVICLSSRWWKLYGSQHDCMHDYQLSISHTLSDHTMHNHMYQLYIHHTHYCPIRWPRSAMFDIRRLTSVICHPSPVICHPSSVNRHPSSVIRHLLSVICHSVLVGVAL